MSTSASATTVQAMSPRAKTLNKPSKRPLTSEISLVKESKRQRQELLEDPNNTTDTTVSKSLQRISSHPSLTPYQRRVYRTLLSVPPGRWTTYATLSAHLSSSARAVGNAMRTNPFAPDVPCHRVLASDRTIGGYKGKWGNGGMYADEKTKLLLGEGIVFDERGRARGVCFNEFIDLGGDRRN